MIEENEVIGLVIATGVLAFALRNRSQLAHLPAWGVLFTAFCMLFAGRVLTVLEGFVLTDAVNLVEHVCYVAGSILLAVWCWRAFAREGDRQ